MKLDKLGKKLRREATANPKKAAFLGLATLVAAYFWAPLVWGWIGKSDKDVSTAAAKTDATSATVVAAPAGQSATEALPDRPPWPQIVQWMHNDPRTMTAPPLITTRDPFESPTIVVTEAKAAEQPKPKLLAITPDIAGLVLTSTIIGPQRRVAQINGKTYVLGQTIELPKDKQALGADFKLIEIHARRAVLEANGQRLELLIPEPGNSDKIQFSASGK